MSEHIYKRTMLAEQLPLKTPFSVDYFLVNNCNLRCVFCGYASPTDEYKYHKRETLSLELFKKTIDDMKAFPSKIKAIHFMGYGEPLLHKDIASMVKYTKESDVAEKIDIITNGVLLNNILSDDLVDAGLDWFRVSVNGLSSEEYKKNCGARIDFQRLVNNIRYLYNNRGSTKIYVKILDYMIDTEEKKKLFYDIFSPISDSISIEYLSDYVVGVDFNKFSKGIAGLSLRGTKMYSLNVCPAPFYMMRINPDGECTPCCEPRFNISLGNVKEISLFDIWNGKRFNALRRSMLDGMDKFSPMCKECKAYKSQTFPEDILDDHVERLKGIYEKE